MSQSAVEQTASETITHQVQVNQSPEMKVVDEITTAILKTSMFDHKRDTRYAGIVDILYPDSYTYVRRRLGRNITVPSVHNTEFIVDGDEGVISAEFHFMQQRSRGLRQKYPDGRWVKLASRPVVVEGQTYQAGNELPLERTIKTGPLKIKALLSKQFRQVFDAKKERDEDVINDSRGKPQAMLVYEVAESKVDVRVLCRKLGVSKYKVSIRVQNLAPIKLTGVRPYNAEEVMRKSLFGAYTTVKLTGCTLLETTHPESIRECVNLSTYPVKSRKDPDTLFSSPVIVYDYPWYEPVKMQVRLKDVVADEQTLLANMGLLDAHDIAALKKTGKQGMMLAVFRALEQSTEGKVDYLYQFQWDAIQKFIKSLVNGAPGVLIVRAPTNSGKSLVFYTCSVLISVLRDDVTGSSTFITFPTRALNSQQFSEMVTFFYHLNEAGIKVKLGLYMGQEDDAAVKILSTKQIKEGDEIAIIQKCPRCSHGRIVATKPSESRIVPKCEQCNATFPYVLLTNWETQDFCPEVVVGTPDKIVNSLTHNVYTHVLFGAPCKQCPSCDRHYALCLKDQHDAAVKCRGCGSQLDNSTKTRSTPRLIIFDEIHTLTGTQGNLLGHFLALLKTLGSVYGIPGDLWYVGATATVANQEELVSNLTGYQKDKQAIFPEKEDFLRKDDGSGYFVKREDRVRHRYVILEPLGVTTRGSVSQLASSLHGFIDEARKTDGIVKQELARKGLTIDESYGTQTIYVLRKDDGRDLEKFIPDFAHGTGLRRPRVRFGSGDLSSSQLVQLNRAVKDHSLDVLLVTQIYGQGVDFPGLNVIHFFGTPRSFIELAQVVGRTGRGNVPGLVLLHLVPQIPRDGWVYENFRHMIADLEAHYEPTPINVTNKYAISLSLPNVFHTLIMARAYEDHQMRYADYVHGKLNTDKAMLRQVMEEVMAIYTTSSMTDQEKKELQSMAFMKARDMLVDFAGSKIETIKHLASKDILVPTLREKHKVIRYSEAVRYSALEDLSSSGEDIVEAEE
jgi:hypothetical protein